MVGGSLPEEQSYNSGQAILKNQQGCEVWAFHLIMCECATNLL